MKRWIKGDNVKDITLMQRFAAGSMAGAVAQTAIFPTEVRINFVYYINSWSCSASCHLSNIRTYKYCIVSMAGAGNTVQQMVSF